MIKFDKISTGALSDLERITKVAYGMVTMYGMNKKIGNISFYDPQKSEYSFTKPYSETTAQIIDTEVKQIIEDCYIRTMKLLKTKKKELELVAIELLEKEVLFTDDLTRLIGERPLLKEETKSSKNMAKDAAIKSKTLNGQPKKTKSWPRL